MCPGPCTSYYTFQESQREAEKAQQMSAVGHKRTLERGSEMSAHPLRADMISVRINVRKVPEAELILWVRPSSITVRVKIFAFESPLNRKSRRVD